MEVECFTKARKSWQIGKVSNTLGLKSTSPSAFVTSTTPTVFLRYYCIICQQKLKFSEPTHLLSYFADVMNGWSLKDFAEQNEDRNQLGWQLENPMSFLMKKRRSPFFGPNPYWVYQDSGMSLQNQVKKQGSIGVEITEPIVRPISYQDFAEQNEAKKTGSLGVEIREPIVRPFSYQDFAKQNEAKKTGSVGVEIKEPIVRPFSYQDYSGQNEDMGLQNYAKKPVIIGVEIKEPVMRPVNLEEPLVISHGKE